jgi:hypothetical protein
MPSGPWRVPGLAPGTRIYRYGGMQKVAFQGPEDFSSIWECKRSPSGDPKSLEDFSGMGAGKKQQQGHHAATFIMQQRQQQKSQQQQKHYSKCMGASKSMGKDKSTDASNSRAVNRRNRNLGRYDENIYLKFSKLLMKHWRIGRVSAW